MTNILIVDDQVGIRELLSEELIDEGYKVACLGDGDLIRGDLRESKIDLILLDLYLNGFEGFELLGHIKRQDPTLPVLIVNLKMRRATSIKHLPIND